MNKSITDTGFSIVEGILTPEGCASIARVLGRGSAGRAGTRNLMSNPAIAALAFDRRLLELANETLGAEAIPFRATLFEKSGARNWHVLWHQDRALPLSERINSGEWGPWTMKAGILNALAPKWALDRVTALRISVDPSTGSNGPLRVIPGSHKSGVLSAADIARIIREREAETCMVGAGGVVAIRPLLLHSSMKSDRREARRVIHIEYATSLDFGSGLRLSVS